MKWQYIITYQIFWGYLMCSETQWCPYEQRPFYVTKAKTEVCHFCLKRYKNEICKLATGKYGCTEVRVYPAECGEQIGRDPQKFGSSKSLVLKRFWVERTFWGSSLLVSLTLWDTPVLFAPPLPLPQVKRDGKLPAFPYPLGFLRSPRNG